MKAGTEEESVYLLHDHLKGWPHLALAAFPASQQWICVESVCREFVEKLCGHLSTFPHPLQIFFIPMDECLTWFQWQHQRSRITAPAWGQLKRRFELEDLLSMGAKSTKGYSNMPKIWHLSPRRPSQQFRSHWSPTYQSPPRICGEE